MSQFLTILGALHSSKVVYCRNIIKMWWEIVVSIEPREFTKCYGLIFFKSQVRMNCEGCDGKGVGKNRDLERFRAFVYSITTPAAGIESHRCQ